MRFPEMYKVVTVGSDLDLNSAAAVDCDSINMKNFHRATFLVNLQTLAGASADLKVYSGATDGAKTSALTFKYAFGGAAQGTADCDVLAAETSAAVIELTHGTYDNYMLVVEVDAVDMDRDNSENWLTMTFEDTDTGATGNVSVFAILEPRYTGNRSASALA
jgi:hypothetical protein